MIKVGSELLPAAKAFLLYLLNDIIGCCLRDTFIDIRSRFMQLYQRKAMLHHYTKVRCSIILTIDDGQCPLRRANINDGATVLTLTKIPWISITAGQNEWSNHSLFCGPTVQFIDQGRLEEALGTLDNLIAEYARIGEHCSPPLVKRHGPPTVRPIFWRVTYLHIANKALSFHRSRVASALARRVSMIAISTWHMCDHDHGRYREEQNV